MFTNKVPALLQKKFGNAHDLISDRELARQVGISSTTIKQWRTVDVFAQVRYEAIAAWCAFFGVGIDDVLGIEAVDHADHD